MTERIKDINGWFEVKGNPISKVGVFPYTGAMIDPQGIMGLDPDQVYFVYRSEKELSDPECIESFKLIPWIDGHVMLGEEFTHAETKGIKGVIGEEVYFDKNDLTLKGNIKVFAENLKEQIKKGKRELSCGYRCAYEPKAGLFDGKAFTFAKTTIRGNHLASVKEGRMGPSVAVLDSNIMTITMDSKELTIMTDEELKKKEAEDKAAEDKKAEDKAAEEKEAKDAAEKKEAEDKAAEDKKVADEEAEKKKAEDAEFEKKKKDGEAMDSLRAENAELKKTLTGLTATVDGLQNDAMKTFMGEVSRRDALAGKVSEFVGTFDHSLMSENDVAVYGVKKLELPCDEGSELATINGFLHNRQPSTAAHGLESAVDSTGLDSEIDNHIAGGKA